jgi:bifunctional non-homologous end joining protein LigD
MEKLPCAYILAKASHSTLYRGVTSDLPGRVWQHREGALVAAPIAWDELDKYEGGNHSTIRDADELLERAGSKALAGWGQAKQALTAA